MGSPRFELGSEAFFDPQGDKTNLIFFRFVVSPCAPHPLGKAKHPLGDHPKPRC